MGAIEKRGQGKLGVGGWEGRLQRRCRHGQQELSRKKRREGG